MEDHKVVSVSRVLRAERVHRVPRLRRPRAVRHLRAVAARRAPGLHLRERAPRELRAADAAARAPRVRLRPGDGRVRDRHADGAAEAPGRRGRTCGAAGDAGRRDDDLPAQAAPGRGRDRARSRSRAGARGDHAHRERRPPRAHATPGDDRAFQGLRRADSRPQHVPPPCRDRPGVARRHWVVDLDSTNGIESSTGTARRSGRSWRAATGSRSSSTQLVFARETP